MGNNNLFYQLYNKGNNNFIGVDYVCPDVVDETGTGFIIDNNKGEIVDSNGDVLQSIDLSNIFADGITQYSVDTKILQPNTTYYIQGMEFGETYTQHYFKICEHITDPNLETFPHYINLEFDVCYIADYEPTSLHVSTKSYRVDEDGENPQNVVDIVNKIFCEFDLPFMMSIEDIPSTRCAGEIMKYIKFKSNLIGVEFNIMNLIVLPIYQSSAYPDSPFVRDTVTVQDVIDAIIYVYPDDNKVNCKLYLYILKNLQQAFDDVYSLTDIPEPYTVDDIKAIIERITEITGLRTIEDKSFYLHRLPEDYSMIVDPLKYPNGAIRGVVLIPDWPDDVDKQKACLKIHHINDVITRYEPVYKIDPEITSGLDYENRNIYYQIMEFIKNGQKVKTLVPCDKDSVEHPMSDVYQIPDNWDGRQSTLIVYKNAVDDDLIKKYDGVEFYYIITINTTDGTDKMLERWVNNGHPEAIQDVLYTKPDNWDGRLETLEKVNLSVFDKNLTKPVDYNKLPDELYKFVDIDVAGAVPFKNRFVMRWINDGKGVVKDLYLKIINDDGEVDYVPYNPDDTGATTSETTYSDIYEGDMIDYVQYPGENYIKEPETPKLLFEEKQYNVLMAYRDNENRAGVNIKYSKLPSVADNTDAYDKYQNYMQYTCKTCFTNKDLQKPFKDNCTCFSDPRGIIGYYGYIDYVNKNNLWLNVSQAYIIVGGADDPDTNERNMLPSLLVYNPYDVPVRVKYMVYC